MNAHPGDHRVTFGPHTWVCGSEASALLAFEALQTEHPGKALRVERCEAVGGWDEEQGVNLGRVGLGLRCGDARGRRRPG